MDGAQKASHHNNTIDNSSFLSEELNNKKRPLEISPNTESIINPMSKISRSSLSGLNKQQLIDIFDPRKKFAKYHPNLQQARKNRNTQDITIGTTPAGTLPSTPTKKYPSQREKSKMDDSKEDNSSTESHLSEANNLSDRVRMPPLVIEKIPAKNIIKILVDNNLEDKFTLKNIKDNKINVHTYGLKDFNLTKQVLTKNDVTFHTYTPKVSKHRSFILKGLGDDVNEMEALEAIKNKEIENLDVTKVSIFKTAPNKPRLFLVQISPASETKNLFTIKSLLYQAVKWESLRKKDVTQCKNCQRPGHVASNCFLNYRCVKCADQHGPGKCKLESTDRKDLFCVNCNERVHPASYRGCPKFKELSMIIKEKSSKASQKRIDKSVAMINPKVSYANVISKNINDSSGGAVSPLSQIAQTTQYNVNTQTQPTIVAASNESNILFAISNKINNIKIDIANMIASQKSDLATMINSNTNKIDFIAKHLGLSLTEGISGLAGPT